MAGWPVKQEQGVASFIVVFIIVILISLVSLGFARLMDRALRDVTSNQLGAAAEYAAQSGLNDAIGFVKQNPGIPVTECNNLDNTSTPLGDYIVNQANGPVISADQQTKYTCILIDPTPGDLAFQNLPPYNSQVVRLEGEGGQLGSVMFSWQAPESEGGTSRSPVVGSGTSFYNENVWNSLSQQYNPPVLRVTLYPINSDNLTTIQNSSRTFYLYPNDNSSGTISYGQPSGSIVGGNCEENPPAPFNTGLQCNVVISGLTPAPYYEARITPLYAAADVIIKASLPPPAGGLTSFLNAQSVIDVTGQSNEALRRIQARVATGGANTVNSGNDGIPEDAIRSASTICKRLIVPDSPVDLVFVDSASINNSDTCGFNGSIAVPTPPTVTLTAIPDTTTVGGTVTLTWTVNGNGVPMDRCEASNNGSIANWTSPPNIPPTNDSRSGVGPLNNQGTITFILTCYNIYGTPGQGQDEVTVNLAPPGVTLTANPNAVQVGQGSTLTWTTSNNPTNCVASGGNWSGNKNAGGDSEPVGPFGSTGIYGYTITCSNSGGFASAYAEITVTTGPPGGGGGGGNCPNGSTGGSGSFPPNACVRDFLFVSWAGDGAATFRVWASHCYSNLNINGTNIGWIAVPSDNSDYYDYTIGFSNSGGTATVTCSGNGTSSASISVSPNNNVPPPPPPPPPCPSPPGSGPCEPPPQPGPGLIGGDWHYDGFDAGCGGDRYRYYEHYDWNWDGVTDEERWTSITIC